MDCTDCIERLYRFLDLELDEAEVAQVRAHIAGCDDCGPEFQFESHFIAQIRELCTSDAAPPRLRDRIALKLRDVGAEGVDPSCC